MKDLKRIYAAIDKITAFEAELFLLFYAKIVQLSADAKAVEKNSQYVASLNYI